MVLKRVDINGCDLFKLTTELGFSQICTIENVGKDEYGVYDNKGEGFCIANLNTVNLVELMATNELNLNGNMIKPCMDEEVNAQQFYIAFTCDPWRSHSSYRLIGAFDEEGLMKYFHSNFSEFQFDGEKITERTLASISVEDILRQRVDYLQVVSSKINEVL